MTHNYSSETYIAASAKLDDACTWLDSLEIEYSQTRIGRYKALFFDLARYQLAGNLDAFYEKYKFKYWVNAVHEVGELVRIYEGLQGQDDRNLITRLRDTLKGHELYVLDSNDRSGRDFSFELAIAAKFARCGYAVDFGHEADLRVPMNEFTFFVECKRLKSPKKAQKRIKDGLKQLHRRYGKSKNPASARGMLALSIGKTINKKLGLLEAHCQKTLGEKAFTYNRAFIEKYKRYWQIKIDRRTLGVAVVLDTPGVIKSKSSQQLQRCHEVTLNNSVPMDSPDYLLLLQITSQVFPKPT